MKISFRTDANLRKLLSIYQVGAPEAITRAMWSYPWLFSDRLESSVKIYNKYIFSKYENKVWYALITDNQPKVIGVKEYSELLRLLARVDVALLKDDDPSFKKISSGIISTYKDNEKKIATHVRNVFGFKMPKEATVILSESGSPGSIFGGALSFDKKRHSVIFGIGVGELRKTNYKSIVGVFVHEILHKAIDMNGTLKKEMKGHRDRERFEEAVLDYFVPDGMLSEKIGLISKKTINLYKEKMDSDRPDSKEISSELLEPMKEYHRSYGKETIWKFLAKRGFGKYINQK